MFNKELCETYVKINYWCFISDSDIIYPPPPIMIQQTSGVNCRFLLQEYEE